jgi:succinate dehydrogenase (ubiquinone) cytochrome b560 subunit
MTPADSYKILVEQRKHRPTSPHLTIYQPQITWYLSSLNRITGAVMSGGVYIFGAAYLVSPLFGWHIDSATLAAGFASWPVAAKVLTKFLVAWPFTYHSFNGVRHLIWDLALQFKNQQVIRTGWTVVGVSTLSALALATLV